MTMSWPSSLLPEGAILGLVAGIAGGVTGGVIGRALDPTGRAQAVPRWVAGVAGLAVVGCMLWPLPITTGEPVAATVTLDETTAEGGRAAETTVRLDPEDAAAGAKWFNVTAWQGGGSVVSDLRPTGTGEYRAAAPAPIHGEWKALIRLHRGTDIIAAPIYLPADPAIPAAGVPARQEFTRPFIADKEILLREAKDSSPWLSYVAYAVLAGILVLWIAALGWGLRSVRTSGSTEDRRGRGVRAPAAPASP